MLLLTRSLSGKDSSMLTLLLVISAYCYRLYYWIMPSLPDASERTSQYTTSTPFVFKVVHSGNIVIIDLLLIESSDKNITWLKPPIGVDWRSTEVVRGQLWRYIIIDPWGIESW